MEYELMKLCECDASGRKKPVPIEGSKTVMDVDTVIVAIGRTPNPIIQSTTPGLETTKGGIIVVDPKTGKTSLSGVYAGGDIATGEATVISAMGSGKKAAQSIHELLSQTSPQSCAPKGVKVPEKVPLLAEGTIKGRKQEKGSWR
jgi:glutamate synthase (NADPH/NADH) small chain